MSCARSLKASHYRRAKGAEGKCWDCEYVESWFTTRTEYHCTMHTKAGEEGFWGTARVSPQGTCDEFRKRGR
jgi:hypothetical protein